MYVAEVVYYDPVNSIEEVAVNGHVIQFGGQGDGYCYGHQTFDCLEELSDEELDAIRRAY